MENLRYLASLWRFWAALIIVGVGLAMFHRFAPPQHNPWRPLSLDDPIGLATYAKFTGLKYSPAACYAALDEAGVRYVRLEDEVTGPDCGFRDALALEQSLTAYSAPVRLTCPMAAALYVWERTAVQPLAIEMFGEASVRIETYGAYSCRNIAGTRRRSEHATANAIDIAGIRLADGRLISVRTHWKNGGKEAAYLERLHDTACRLFSVTLGPDYNAAHEDHFHFDFGSGDLCR